MSRVAARYFTTICCVPAGALKDATGLNAGHCSTRLLLLPLLTCTGTCITCRKSTASLKESPSKNGMPFTGSMLSSGAVRSQLRKALSVEYTHDRPGETIGTIFLNIILAMAAYFTATPKLDASFLVGAVCLTRAGTVRMQSTSRHW